MSTPSCPDCLAPLTGAPTCPACGLRLTGAEAGRLWAVDQTLMALETRRVELLADRGQLLAALRSSGAPAATAAPGPTTAVPAATAAAPGPTWTAPAQPPRAEWTPQRVQNTLLGLGALLLTVAGVVFAAVTYDRLGAGGRAAVLAGLTLLAGLAVPRLKARSLDATAESLAAVTLALAALDAYGLRTLGLADGSSARVYVAGSAAALGLVAGLYALVVPVRLPRIAAVALAHLPVPLLLATGSHDAGAVALGLALLAAADVGVQVLLPASQTHVRRAVLACGTVSAALAGLIGGLAAFGDSERTGAVALLALAAVAAAAGVVAARDPSRLLLTALAAPLAATAALALSQGRLDEVQRPLVLVAVALVAIQLAALLPRDWRAGPVAGALLTTVGALTTQAEAVAQAAVLPLTWLGDPWTLVPDRDARHALAPSAAWNGTVVTLVVLAAAAVVVAGAGLALHRVREAAAPTAVLVVLAAVVLPLGLATSYPLAIVALLAGSVALLTAGATNRRRDLSLCALIGGTALALLVAAWSTADQGATLLVLPVLALAFAAVAVRRPEAAGPAGLLAGAFVAAGGAARGLRTDQVGGLLLLVPALLVSLTFVLGGVRRVALELAAAVLAATAVILTVGDVGWLSWTLAVGGLIALADALHPDRRLVAAAGALLLSSSSWVRLADSGISAPEPYVVPLGLVALALGWLRVRRLPQTRSFAAYGPGLSLLLLPSLVASLADDTLTRPLLLGAAATTVLLVGAQQRLQAPLLVGGGVLAVDALHLLAPYAAALPRWLSLGVAGLLLVTVGATYEQRRRDVSRMRERFEALA